MKNPLDMIAALFDINNFKILVEILENDPNIDIFIFSQSIQLMYDLDSRELIDQYIAMIIEFSNKMKTAMYIMLDETDHFESSSILRETKEKYNVAGVTYFPSFELGSKIINNLNQYRKFIKSVG
ncbi:hypothetical protein KKA14_16170 [bacterium]|nr:hypothetical protein [bacterium]